jgi:hypothetical protein
MTSSGKLISGQTLSLKFRKLQVLNALSHARHSRAGPCLALRLAQQPKPAVLLTAPGG